MNTFGVVMGKLYQKDVFYSSPVSLGAASLSSFSKGALNKSDFASF